MLSSLGILAGVAVIWMAMQSRRQIREMEHRERLAMIERGLAPAPEVDPAAFERKLGGMRAPESPSASRARSGGVMMVALGLAFMFMLAFAAGEPGVGIGIGGAFALRRRRLLRQLDPARPISRHTGPSSRLRSNRLGPRPTDTPQ